MYVPNAKELRDFLNELPDDELEEFGIRASYSEDVEPKTAEVYFNYEEGMFEILSGSEVI